MCYIIEQTAGHLDDLARRVSDLVRTGDRIAARKLYTDLTGQPGAIIESTCWWMYCVDRCIRSHTGLTDKERAACIWDGQTESQYFYAIRSAAARKNGGTWIVRWEY